MSYTEPDTESLLTELQEILEANGGVPDAQRQILQLKMLKAIYRLVQPLPKQVEELQEKSLIILAQKHPRIAAACVAGFFLVLELWHSAAWRPWLSKLFGIPIP